MPKLNLNLFLDDDFETYGDRREHRLVGHRPGHQPKRSTDEVLEDISGEEGRDNFNFSYHASRHESEWLIDSLGHLYEEQWLDDVLRLLQGGKEASVYLCLGNTTVLATYLAAKVYRPRRFRSLKKDHIYREGRANLDADGNVIINGGQIHAMRKRTAFGLELLHTSWIEHEYQTMQLLDAAGADVPKVFARGHNAILMEYIGGTEMPAPTLITVDLPAGEASILFERVIQNIEIMLSSERVHGDLSAYNILYWQGDIKLIDFPQAINPNENRNAYRIFERDLARICEYFTRQGVRNADPGKLAPGLWKTYGYPIEPDIDPGLLDDQRDGSTRDLDLICS